MKTPHILTFLTIIATSILTLDIVGMAAEAPASDSEQEIEAILTGIHTIELHRLSNEEQFAQLVQEKLASIAEEKPDLAESSISQENIRKQKVRLIRRDAASFTNNHEEKDDNHAVGKKRTLSAKEAFRQVKQHPSSPASPQSPMDDQ